VLILSPTLYAQEKLETLQAQRNNINLSIIQIQAQQQFIDSQIIEYLEKKQELQSRVDGFVKQRDGINKKIKVMESAPAEAPDK
jgi:chromosome segregation ATPase